MAKAAHSTQHAHADLGLGAPARAALALAGEGDGPELVGVAAVGALGVVADVARRQHAALDAVQLRDELAVPRQVDVPALQQDLEMARRRARIDAECATDPRYV